MFFSNRNNSYCVLNSSMCRSPARQVPDLHYFSPSPPARYHHHHYRWEYGGSMRLRNSPAEKAKPRYRLREDPAPVPHQPPCRPLCLHLPAGLPDAFCSTRTSLPKSWHVRSIASPVSLGTWARLVPSAPEGAPGQMPSLGVPALLPHCQGQWEWHQPDGVA